MHMTLARDLRTVAAAARIASDKPYYRTLRTILASFALFFATKCGARRLQYAQVARAHDLIQC
jgi:hypothetical protein